LFKLNPFNGVLLLAAPTLFFKSIYKSDIDDRLSNIFRIHENREKQGLGGTY